jgi:cytochrome P450
MNGWLVVEYEAVREAARTQKFSVDSMGPFFEAKRKDPVVKELEAYVRHWLVMVDPPRHSRLRAAMSKGLAASRINAMEPTIRRFADQLFDNFEQHDEVDFIREFAYPLPAMVVGKLMGVPDALLPEIKEWSDDLAQFVSAGPGNREQRWEIARKGSRNMAACFQELIGKRRKQGGEDMLTQWVKNRDDGIFETDEELIGNCQQMVFAGHETTTNLFANGLYHLLRNPDQMTLLREGADPATAVEEFLRYESPVHTFTRVVKEDMVFHGQELQAGQRVFAFATAAHRDPAVFANPDALDITRTPNPHMAFGAGIHSCLGAPLARLEGKIVFEMLPQRFEDIQLLDPEPPFKPLLLLRGMEHLKLAFTPAA